MATHAPVVARIVDGPLTPAAARAAFHAAHAGVRTSCEEPNSSTAGEVGAALRFEGIVRRGEPCDADGGRERALQALEYQTYDPMAELELQRIARDVAQKRGLASLKTLHSRGHVSVGQVSFVLAIESAHRVEALAAMAEFIDRLKRDVPIWKKPVWA